MKAMYCEVCGTITSPGPKDFEARSCSCGRHRCWWVDGRRGVFRVECFDDYPADHPSRSKPGAPVAPPRVWVLGINNSLLFHEAAGTPSAEQIEQIINETPPSYIFRQTRSCIIRIRPGQSGDTDWARLEDK